MEIEFYGAAREVTGSCHLVHTNGRTIVLDCGLFQGHRKETQAKNLSLPFRPDEVDAVILSHAHIDHAGRLPYLVSKGYQKTIWCTPATRDLAAIMLADSAYIQEKDAEYLARKRKEAIAPLYTVRDAARATELMVGLPYGRTFDVLPGVRATFVDAGHILGSASVLLDCTEHGDTHRLLFGGDIGRWGQAIIRDPQIPGGARTVIMESTYGNRDHESVAGARAHLARVVRETAAKGGRIIIPAFAVGRTQEMLYDLHLLARAGEIPAIPIYVDSPLAIDATAVFAAHPETFDRSEDLVGQVQEIFRFERVTYTRSVEESKAINATQGPLVVVAASGMAESGRILHHLKNGAADPRNTILVVGFMAEHTLGRRIVEKRPTLKIFGEEVSLRARVEVINGFSAHADRTELTRWLDGVREQSPQLRDIYLVHGEPEPQDALAGALGDKGYRVSCPAPGDRVASG